ncbi:MAG: sigma-70 family RNA polymerase sigma factor [Planctomycetaceae bacterium]
MSEPMGDAELMLRVQEGQLACFDELVCRYRVPLTRVALSKTGDAGRAEDIVQETFLAVYASRQSFNPKFAFRTWLWTILLNLCRRDYRKRSRTPRVLPHTTVNATASETYSTPVSLETGLTHVLQVEQGELVAKLLNELPEVQADAIRLRFYGALTYREIAEAMKSSEIGAKVRVKKGLQNLAERLRTESGETK